MIFVEQYWQNNRVTVSKDFFTICKIFFMWKDCVYIEFTTCTGIHFVK